MPKSPKLGKINFSSLSLPEQIQMSNLQDAVNILGGHSGEIELSNHLSLGGNRIKNVAPAQEINDATPLSTTEERYSATALKPHLEACGKASLRSYITALQGDVVAKAPGNAQATVTNVTGLTFSQVGGNLDISQLPVAGVTTVVTLAKLTVGGTNGSITVNHGLITAVVQPT